MFPAGCSYVVATFGWWAETVTTTATSWGQAIADKFKVEFSCNTGAALLGLGYIVGLKYAFVIFAGSIRCLSTVVRSPAPVWWQLLPEKDICRACLSRNISGRG